MIRLEKDGGLWRVVIARTARANALTGAMLADIAAAAEAARHEGAKAFILTGEGKIFSAGADLEEVRAGLATDPVWERVSGAIAALPCLTLAALNGTLAGGAFGMALACDLRIAVPDARFFYPVMKLGFLPQPSDPNRLAALIGQARAKMVLMAGAKIGADEALDWGLVDRVVAPADLPNCVAELTGDVLGADPTHIAGIKALFSRGPGV